MRCVWCKEVILPEEDCVTLPGGCSGALASKEAETMFHSICLFRFERQILWGKTKEDFDVS